MLINFLIVFQIMTLLTMLVYAYDFAVANGQWERKNRQRIPEFNLLALAALGGAFGAWLMMVVQHHKTSDRKPHFRFVIYLSLGATLVTLTTLFLLEHIGG